MDLGVRVRGETIMGFRRFLLLMFSLVFGAAATPALAVDVRPSERVVRWVNVRAGPASNTAVLEKLEPGEAAELVEVVPGWYKVRLPDGQIGYVSRAWTVRSDALAAFSPVYFVHMIDVGTGLAIFVEGPGFNLLYDGGSNDDTALGDRNRLLAYLRFIHPGLTRIDHLILSHPHRDHVELLPDALRGYSVTNVWDSGRTNPICSYRAFLRAVRDRNSLYHDAHGSDGMHAVPLEAKSCYGEAEPAETVVIPHASPIVPLQPITLGPGAILTFLHADASELDSFNENSLVAAIDLGRSRLLLMGDAEAGGRRPPNILPSPSSVEGKLLACCASALRADILVAGHHGSKTSSRTAFLDKVGAYVFLVSAGPKRYATVTLPDAEVIDELETRGTVYRTDSDDPACLVNPAKMGPDNDKQPGGCDNVLVSIDAAGEIHAEYRRSAD
jgi:competence protein ComEC